jgi:molybdopterin synthase catalytic subunit
MDLSSIFQYRAVQLCPDKNFKIRFTIDHSTYVEVSPCSMSVTKMDQHVVDDRFLIAVTEDLPTLEACYQFVAAEPSCGAVSTFVGITRNNFQGKIVEKLSYEGYVPMAMKELHKLCLEAVHADHYPSVRRIAMVHILGDCPVGQASVIMACSSPHRTDAIHCCEYLINELKARIPIWKLEVYQGDGGSVWKENVEWHEGRRRRVMVKQNVTGTHDE